MSKLANKVAVVTGAAKGIGAGIAKALAAEGAAVVVNYAASKSGAERVVSEITAAGGKAIAVQADVSKPDDIARLFAQAKDAFGTLDVLVNNAGFGGYGPFARTGIAREVEMIATNVTALTVLAKAVLPAMLERGSGRILNVGSTASFAPGPFAAVYAATK
eukprot:gene46199-57609_t